MPPKKTRKKTTPKAHKKPQKSTKYHQKSPINSNRFIYNIALFLSLFIVVGAISLFLLVVMDEKSIHVTTAPKVDKAEPLNKLFTKMDTLLKENELDVADHFSEIKDYQNSLPPISSTQKQEIIIKKEPILTKVPDKKPKHVVANTKPKLAIIIDDVGSATQIKRIQGTGLKLNMALFPPTANFPNTPQYAKELPFYMIHLPLEAMKFNKPQDKTLLISSSSSEIEARIAEVRRHFPKSHYINNHTGSKFTSDRQAMKHLFTALKKYDYHFIDSRTSAKSKVRELVRQFDFPLIERDVFIDNKDDVEYIESQLRKAVKIAKKHGQAIAIGHPHLSTMQAIKNSKKLFREVELVYVTEL
jgi:uncharacterized protein